jgi:hypothetical protein
VLAAAIAWRLEGDVATDMRLKPACSNDTATWWTHENHCASRVLRRPGDDPHLALTDC